MVKYGKNLTIRMFIILTVLLFYSINFLNYAAGQDFEKSRFEEAAKEYGFKLNYRKVVEMLELNRIEEYVFRFASFRGRFTGYRGADEAAKFIYEIFNTFTDHAELQNYTIVVPVDEGAKIKILTIDDRPNGTVIEANPLFPNLAQQCIVPEDGIIGRLLYIEEGIRSEDLNGSILLMDFNTGSYWLEAAKMGAKAVVFIQPDISSSDESFSKMVYTELYFPRLIVSREIGLGLKKIAAEHKVEIAITSRIVYKKVPAYNVVGFIWGNQFSNETIVVSAYYDDWCIAPSLAGGYDSAVGVSLLLELARVFSMNRPSRNMLFLATSGHWQAAYGIKNFVMNMLLSNNPRQLPFRLGSQWNETTYFFVSLDLSTRCDKLALVSTGGLFHMSTRVYERNIGDPPSVCGLDRLYGGDERIYRGFPDICEAISRSLNMTFKVRAHLTEVLAGGSFNTTGLLGEYFTAIPEKYFVEAEVWLAAGLPGITFYTCALRKGWFSPAPINDISIDNLRPQAAFITSFIHFLGNAKRKAFIGSRNPDFATVDFAGPTRFYIGRFSNTPVGLARMRVQTYEYNASEILQYSPVHNPMAYAVDKEEEGNIFYYTFSIGSENGTFEMIGFLVRPLTGFTYPRPFLLRAFVVNSTTGEIIYAPDFGIFGGRRFIDTVMLRSVESPDYGYPNPLRLILFKAGSITLFDVFHPRVYSEPKWTDSFNMELFSKLKGGLASRPFIHPAEPGIRVYYVGSRVEAMSYGTTYDFERQICTIFIPPGTRVEIHVVLKSEQEYVETVAMLTNASESKPRGHGFYVSRPGENIMITETLYRIAKDIYWRSKSIVETCLSLSVFDEAAIKNLRDLEHVLNEIENSRKMGKIDEISSLQILAYADASNSLISSENLLVGARSTAVVFFLLLIPFTLFSEKLITEFRSGKKRLIVIMVLFCVFSVPLIYLHPGFVLIENLSILILGFVTEIVLLLVFLLFWRESGTVVKEYKVAFKGKHFFEKSRFETAVFMF
ncbi:MAG: M28 family peptidase, partial [Candidatus Bathyarchaeia archaeon]